MLLAAVFLGGTLLLRAGTIITLTNGSEIDGKLSVTAANLHADGPSGAPDTALTDVLESNFGDDPFQLSTFYFGKAGQLPPSWQAQNIGEVTPPGSVSVHDGTFTLTTGGFSWSARRGKPETDNLFFVGQPWIDNGQFTARLLQTDAKAPQLATGIMFRESLDPQAATCGAIWTALGIHVSFRGESRHAIGHESISGDAPIWFRFTRINNEVLTATSPDGAAWSTVSDYDFKDLVNPVVGLEANSGKDGTTAQALFDQVSITPLPSSARMLPAGVVLQGGSVLAGHFEHVNLNPDAAEDNGTLMHAGKRVQISRSQIAAVLPLPTERAKLMQYGSKPGLLMRNGDTMDGDISEIGGGQVTVNSIILGNTNYKSTEVNACFIHPLQPQPAAYEVRLKDGSILNATAVNGDANEVVITDVSGMTIQADQTEVAQIRAGTSVVQNLAELDWKATPAPGSATAAPAATPAPTVNPPDAGAAAANNNGAAPAAPGPPPAPQLVDEWLGKNQEQLLETSLGTSIEFPLPGKFRAFGTQVALSSDSPPSATVTIHVLVDGQEVGKVPCSGARPPSFISLSLAAGATRVAVRAESMYAGAKVVYIDPVAIRN